MGLTLHPFDLATNKVLALVGRVEPRDYIDALRCHERVAPLGLLAWGACGKDEGWNPHTILDEATRNNRISSEELAEMDWDGPASDLTALKVRWREALHDARALVGTLPVEAVGHAVLSHTGQVFRGDSAALRAALQAGQLLFHSGHIGGVWPQLKP